MLSPRIHAFHETLVAAIPCQPESAHDALRKMSTPELLIRYLNWADRYVAPRPRRVVTWEGFVRHGTAKLHRKAVYGLAEKIQAGDDLTPFLSKKIRRFGYVIPKDDKQKPRSVEWRDKDYALNAYDTHHLHLNKNRTRSLLYVSFSRSDALFVMVGDHDSFDDGTLAQAIAECRVGTPLELKGIRLPARRGAMREQNLIQRHGFSAAFSVGDRAVMGALLSSAGTSVRHTTHAASIARALKKMEPQLDDPSFCEKLFQYSGRPCPVASVFQWVMRHCDLCLTETTSGVNFVVVQWIR
jgi:hypothetical protein